METPLTTAKCPGSSGVAADTPSGHVVPGGQLPLQLAALSPSAEPNRPAGQFVQVHEPLLAANVPAAQFLQMYRSAPSSCFPVGQSAHASLPTSALNLPAVQLLQFADALKF